MENGRKDGDDDDDGGGGDGDDGDDDQVEIYSLEHMTLLSLHTVPKPCTFESFKPLSQDQNSVSD